MTHYKDITPRTREFTDESYMKLHTPQWQLWTPKQRKGIAEQEAKKDAKENRVRDLRPV